MTLQPFSCHCPGHQEPKTGTWLVVCGRCGGTYLERPEQATVTIEGSSLGAMPITGAPTASGSIILTYHPEGGPRG